MHPAYMAQSAPTLKSARADALDLAHEAMDVLALLSAAMQEHHKDHSRMTQDFQAAHIHVNAAWRAVGYACEAIDH